MLQEELVVNYPEGAVSSLIVDDAFDARRLPDEVIASLWDLVYGWGWRPEMAITDDQLRQARDGRRTRPPRSPHSMRYPLIGGGHRSGLGRGGKTEFPVRWTDDQVMDHVMAVAQQPDDAVQQPNGTFRAWGVRDGVRLVVILTPDGELVTGYPLPGPGIIHNPLDIGRTPYVDRLCTLLDATLPGGPDEQVRAGLDEQLLVGEWDQVLLQLAARGVPADHYEEMCDLLYSAGEGPPGWQELEEAERVARAEADARREQDDDVQP